MDKYKNINSYKVECKENFSILHIHFELTYILLSAFIGHSH